VNQQLGHLKLKEVDAARIQEFFGWLQSTARNKDNGSPLSKNTIRLHRMLLSSMFREAVAKEFVPFNPCTGQRVTLPPLDAKPAYSCTTEDVDNLKAQIEKEPPIFRAMVTLLLNAGLRKGELHGLQWSDFNPSTGTLTIARQLQYIEHKGFLTCETKSKTGMRSFKLPAPAVAALLEWQTEQSKWRDTIGTEVRGTGYKRKFTTVHDTVTGRDWPTSAPWMFTDEYGSPRYPDSFHKRLKAFLKRAGFTEDEVKEIHSHTLRHTNASIMVANGVDYATAAARLGDSQQTVMKYYAHARKEADEKAAAALEAAFT
jgi:integrase